MKHTVEITAILSIVVLETIALFQGINGTMYSVAISGIAGICGYTFGKTREK